LWFPPEVKGLRWDPYRGTPDMERDSKKGLRCWNGTPGCGTPIWDSASGTGLQLGPLSVTPDMERDS